MSFLKTISAPFLFAAGLVLAVPLAVAVAVMFTAGRLDLDELTDRIAFFRFGH